MARRLGRLEIPDIPAVAGGGPVAILAEIRRSLNNTAASIEASLPVAPALPMALPTLGVGGAKGFIKGLEVQVETVTGVKTPLSVSDLLPGAAPAAAGAAVTAARAPLRKPTELVFE